MKNTKQLSWKNVRVTLGDLRPWGHNPRKSDKVQKERIAGSFAEHGQALPFLIGPNNEVYDGHQRLSTLLDKHGKKYKIDARQSSRPLTEKERRKLVIDLHAAATGTWDPKVFQSTWNIKEVQDWFPKDALRGLRAEVNFFGDYLTQRTPAKSPHDPVEAANSDGSVEAAQAAKFQKKWKVKRGDVWTLDGHRIICGDSTDPKVLKRLFGKGGGQGSNRAVCLHADGPYGMGKEADGIQNDNLRAAQLDKFQLKWWDVCRPYLFNNASVYIWGNAVDLFRLWFVGGLKDREKLTLRNEIVWDKNDAPGMASDRMTQYVNTTERCLFIQIGEQYLGNVNSDSYWDGWDELRLPLVDEIKAAGLTPKRVAEITGVGMYSHWFSKSQWQLIPKKYYELLAAACPGFFLQPHEKMQARYASLLGGLHNMNGETGRDEGIRAYFDNSHAIMRDVFDFKRVKEVSERWGIVTPKPVEMMVQIVKTSAFEGGIVLEPFLGSGSTLIACDLSGRICYGVDNGPAAIATTLERWSKITGKKPVLKERTGRNGKH